MNRIFSDKAPSIDSAVRYIFWAPLFVYQTLVGPTLSFLSALLGIQTHCKYPITCSSFAKDEIANNPSLGRALTRILFRLMQCGPWFGIFKE